METNETLETVIKFGVPTLETCKALDWQKETLFVWSNTPMREMFQLLPYCLTTDDNFTIPAPQMHEIAPHIYELDGASLEIINGVWASGTQPTLSYKMWWTGKRAFRNSDKMEVAVYNHHYAEAYAKLHIKLREAGLLENK